MKQQDYAEWLRDSVYKHVVLPLTRKYGLLDRLQMQRKREKAQEKQRMFHLKHEFGIEYDAGKT